MGRTGHQNSQAANDWAARKQQALEHARQLRAQREAAAEAKYASGQDDAPAAPQAASHNRAPMDALDQHMNTGSARTVCTPGNNDYHHQPIHAAPHDSHDAIESFMGHEVPEARGDILGGLEHIGAHARSPAQAEPHPAPSYSQTCDPDRPPPRQPDTGLSRQNSLALLKKRNPNATRRPRPPKVPAQVLDAARCASCAQLAKDCVDCNYCHALFCRDHFEDAASSSGRCPSCDHRCGSYDCTENLPMQRMCELLAASLAGELQETDVPSPHNSSRRHSQCGDDHPRPSSRTSSRRSSKAGDGEIRGFGAIVNDNHKEESYADGLTAGVRRKSRPTPPVAARRGSEPQATQPEAHSRAPAPEYDTYEQHQPAPPVQQHDRWDDTPPQQHDRWDDTPPQQHDRWDDDPEPIKDSYARKPPAAKAPKKKPAVKKQPPPREQPPPVEYEQPPPLQEEQPAWNDSTPGGLPPGLEEDGGPMQMSACAGCNRKFRMEVLQKHEPKCLAKANGPKRKVFDAKKQALVGTGAEKFIEKTNIKAKPITGKARDQKSEDKPVRGKVPKWKQQSEDLKNAMRSERDYKAAIKAGKPPPPPAAASAPDPSLVPCPHCGRRFNANAAERHIPKCATSKAKPTRLLRGGGGAAGNNALAARQKAKKGAGGRAF